MTMSIDGTPSPTQDGGTVVQDGSRRPEQANSQQASTSDAPSQQRPDSPNREEYADTVRETGSPIRGARGDHRGLDDHEPVGQENLRPERPADRGPSELDDREAQRTDTGAVSGKGAEDGTGAAASPVTHFHGEFKGRPMDLYTDGTRWSEADQVRGENVVGVSPDVPDLFPTGEELVDSAGEDSPRLERLRREMYRESDDLLDGLEKTANLTSDIFSHPPTSSYQSTPVDRPYISQAQHSGIDVGSMATTAFVLGVVIDRGIRSVVQHYKEHARGE
jgi:hypothetical protein